MYVLIVNVNPSSIVPNPPLKLKSESKTSRSKKVRQTAQHLFIRESVVKIARKIIILLSPREWSDPRARAQCAFALLIKLLIKSYNYY